LPRRSLKLILRPLMRLSLFSGLFLAIVSGVFATEDSDVIDLTAANFDSIVNPAELILVEFFAPW
jgi:protein disulfide-isomerase A1